LLIGFAIAILKKLIVTRQLKKRKIEKVISLQLKIYSINN